MAATAYRYLVNIPGVRGGNTIVENTHIGVHDVIGLISTGDSVDEVIASLPDLTRAQVFECLAYYEDHRDEIDSLMATQASDPAPPSNTSEESRNRALAALDKVRQNPPYPPGRVQALIDEANLLRKESWK